MTRWWMTPLALAAVVGALSTPSWTSQSSRVMVAALSADGRYVASSHSTGEVLLWDMTEGTRRIVAEDANIYSAHIPIKADFLLWQDVDGTVYRQTFHGTPRPLLKTFPGYGHVATSDGRRYVVSNKRWQLFQQEDGDSGMTPIKLDGESPGFLGIGKLLNLSIHEDRCLLLSAGDDTDENDMPPAVREPLPIFSSYAGVVLWDYCANEPLFKLPGNSAKTHATLSPDGRYVVSVDENGLSFVWETETGELAYEKAYDLRAGVYVGGPEFGSPDNWDNSGAHLEYPEDFPEGFHGGSKIAVQFISDTDYLVFFTYQPYAVLYTLGDPFALKVFDLGDDPFPSVSNYARNASIATSPEANLLVTGQRDGGGINVYRFNPDTRELTREWVGRPRPWWWAF